MRTQKWLLAAAIVLGVPMIAAAQTTTTTGTTAQTTTAYDLDAPPSHWMVSGFVGSNFGAQTDGTSVDLGGSLGYLWRSAVGLEFLAGFSPNFELENSAVLLGEKPQVNSYMVNAMGAIPIGSSASFQPFVSAGLGAITLRSDVLSGDSDNFDETLNPDDSKFGGNVGFGVMGFAGNVGLRGDVRYFRAFESGDSPDTAGEAIASDLLSGLDFWRANIGVAIRW
jgi:hypothetical protein